MIAVVLTGWSARLFLLGLAGLVAAVAAIAFYEIRGWMNGDD